MIYNDEQVGHDEEELDEGLLAWENDTEGRQLVVLENDKSVQQ